MSTKQINAPKGASVKTGQVGKKWYVTKPTNGSSAIIQPKTKTLTSVWKPTPVVASVDIQFFVSYC